MTPSTDLTALNEKIDRLRRSLTGLMGAHVTYADIAWPVDALNAIQSDLAALPREAPPALVALHAEWQAASSAYGDAETAEEHDVAQKRMRRARDLLMWWPRHPSEAMPSWNEWYPPPPAPAPPCPLCGKDSADGDWYRVCGPCRWNVTTPDAAAPPQGHQIVARDRDGMPWCETCRKWGVREDGVCDRTYPGTVAAPVPVPPPPVEDMPEIQVSDWVCQWGGSVHKVDTDQALEYWTERTERISDIRGERNGQPFIWQRRKET